MAVANGSDFQILVEDPANAGVYIAVADMDGEDESTDQQEDVVPVFGNTKYVIPGVRDVTFSVSGYHNGADTGQSILRTAEKTSVAARIKVLYDGVNGFTVLTRVRSRKHSAKPTGLQPVSFDFIATAASALIG